MSLLKKIFNHLHPVLKPLFGWYLSRTHTYRYKGITIKILPTVFHPGLFFSTNVFLNYLEKRELHNKRILELGAGSGLISMFCSQRGGKVVASDISPIALQGIYENVKINNVSLSIIESDLFDRINPGDFDLIVINPPYFPNAILSTKDLPWFCGANFEYFEKLFLQLRYKPASTEVLMILSEDCDLVRIESIASKNQFSLLEIHTVKIMGEQNFIFRINE